MLYAAHIIIWEVSRKAYFRIIINKQLAWLVQMLFSNILKRPV